MADFIGGNAFRIQIQVHAQRFIQQRRLTVGIFLVAHTGHCVFGAKSLGHTAGHQIHFIAFCYSNKHISITDFRHSQNFRTAAVAPNSQHVKGIFDNLTTFIILFNHHNIIRSVCQQLGNTVTHPAGSHYNNTHKITCLSLYYAQLNKLLTKLQKTNH